MWLVGYWAGILEVADGYLKSSMDYVRFGNARMQQDAIHGSVWSV